MKKFYAILITLTLFSISYAQDFKYMRSSLATLMVLHEEDSFALDMENAFAKIPCPEKYDDHILRTEGGQRITYVANKEFTGAQKKQSGLIKAKYGKTLNAKEIEKNGKAIENYLNSVGVAQMFVLKWFGYNAQTHPYFDMELVKERGNYNATAFDVDMASQMARGLAVLEDAGEQLIGNTYMLVNDMTYVTAEEKAAAAKVALNILGAIFDGMSGGNSGRQLAQTAGKIADSYTGFKVKTHSYLYRLDWNDSIAAVFYSQYWIDEKMPAEEAQKRYQAMIADPMWRIYYVAHEYEYDSKSALKGKYDRGEFIKTICTRSMDKNIAALQLKYEDFKVKTPVFDIVDDGAGTVLAAKIGLKEGITENSSFQVIQPVMDEEGRTKYKYVATVKPIKGKIWDNRYNAAEEKEEGSELNFTSLRKVAGGSILPGMLIVEGKYRKVVE